MERKLQEVKLSNGEVVKIISVLTWGEKEAINNSLIKGAKIDSGGMSGYDIGAVSESKYVALGLCVKEIVPSVAGEASHGFTKEWMNELSVEDGDLVYEAVDALTKKKG